MTWLITGGAGYIGAHVVRVFGDAGESVVVLDDLSAGVRARVPEVVPFYEGSVLDADLLDLVMGSHDIVGVVHMAGKKSAPESVREPELYAHVNSDGTRVLLDACLRHAVRHFVFSSTAAVYGMVDSAAPITEDAPTIPINPYGQTKLDAEHALEKATTWGGIDAIAFRYFNVGGAASMELEDLHGENLLPILYRALDAQSTVQVFGVDLPTRDGSCIRDYVHVQDIAEAHLAAARYLVSGARQAFEVVNLGSGKGSTVLEVIAAVERVTGRSIDWQAAPPRDGDPVASTCDATRAADLLGWHASRTLDEIAARPPA